uniref:Uncharacterized protein n=1 Tax=Cacopsylla melanoneura TaxID=428564 RepID=A0A8D8L9R9_9HEMI
MGLVALVILGLRDPLVQLVVPSPPPRGLWLRCITLLPRGLCCHPTPDTLDPTPLPPSTQAPPSPWPPDPLTPNIHTLLIPSTPPIPTMVTPPTPTHNIWVGVVHPTTPLTLAHNTPISRACQALVPVLKAMLLALEPHRPALLGAPRPLTNHPIPPDLNHPPQDREGKRQARLRVEARLLQVNLVLTRGRPPRLRRPPPNNLSLLLVEVLLKPPVPPPLQALVNLKSTLPSPSRRNLVQNKLFGSDNSGRQCCQFSLFCLKSHRCKQNKLKCELATPESAFSPI